MTDKEKKDWKDLCKYVEKDILNYDNSQHMQKDAILRLKGICTGTVYANNAQKPNGNYPFEVIILAFKANKQKILSAIQNKDFESEGNKMGYIAAIIRGDINEIYQRWQNMKQSEENVKKTDVSRIVHKGSRYKRKTVDKEQYEELW